MPKEATRPSVFRTLRRSSLWRQRITAALSLGSSMRSFDAPHLLVLLFPTLGMVPAVAAAASVYLQVEPQFRNATETDPMLRFTPISFYPEPFASLTNLCYVTSGLVLFLLPMLSGSFLAPHVFGVGMLYSFLGAGSWAFHKDASRVGHWQHAADRIGMFSAFTYLGVVVISGAFHSARRTQVTPRSWSTVISNLTCMGMVMLVIVYQDQIDTNSFLGGFGTLIVCANGLTTVMLAMHRRNMLSKSKSPHACAEALAETEHHADATARSTSKRICFPKLLTICHWRDQLCARMVHHPNSSAILEGIFEAGLCSLQLLIGLIVNFESARCKDAAAYDTSLSDATRQSLRTRHDILHGTWHYIASMAMLAMALTMHRGLTCIHHEENEKRQPPAGKQSLPALGHKEEAVSKMLILAITLLFLVLLPNQLPELWIFTWIVLLITILPFSTIALYNVVQRHDATWEKRVASLRDALSRGFSRKVIARPSPLPLTTTV